MRAGTTTSKRRSDFWWEPEKGLSQQWYAV